MGAAFPVEPLALAMGALGGLLFDARHLHLAADPRLAAMERQQHPHQLVEIDPVRLDPPLVPLHLDARGIEDMVLHAVIAEPAV